VKGSLFRFAWVVRRLLGKVAAEQIAAPSQQQSLADVFTAIYRANAWQNAESRSGHGSTVARCEPVMRALTELVEEFKIKTLLDAPCGDFNWMKEVALPGVAYVGIDVVAEMIERNRRLYGGPSREFRCLDVTRGPLPRADVIFCRDCLVHLRHADVRKALATFQRSGSRYLVVTTFPSVKANEDVTTGGWRPLTTWRRRPSGCRGRCG
jgi:2-polyprenyl-3-methyl-5-hydroxy-6-metoxy-1,4-benzoquinol methylase